MSTETMKNVALQRLWWLGDAPLFIDEQLVASFYDAVVRPEFELHGKTIGRISEQTNSLLLRGGVGAELGLPRFLSFLKADAKVKAEAEASHERSAEEREDREWRRVHTAGRKLEELVAVYVDDQRFHSRLLFTDCPMSGIQTLAGELIEFKTFQTAYDSFPRSLVFFEVKPEAAIIPTMCEFSTGGFAPLYDLLISKLWAAREAEPKYPSSAEPGGSAARQAYWRAIGDRYDSRIAMEVLEGVVTDGKRIDWIDFRLRLNQDGQTLHLHICPRGLYSAGVFGYNFIRRGNRKGVRIVGSLKHGPDLNVLAIFEC